MSVPADLERVELRVGIRPASAGPANPTVDAGAVAKVINAAWIDGTYRICIVVEESPRPEQVGVVAVVQAGAVRVRRGDETT